MKKQFFLILAFFFSIVCSAEEPTKYELVLKDYIELKVTDGINVDYKCNPDSAGIVVFETIPQLASQIIFVPGEEKLEIQLATNENGKYENLPTITTYSTFLSKIENSGDSLVKVITLAPQAKFKAKLIGNGRLAVHNIDVMQLDASINTGNGTITLSGKTKSATLKATGSGNIQADGLVAETVRCNILGTGSIGCNAIENLSVLGAGTGKVYYKGDPKIKNRSLNVKILRIE